MIEMKCTRHNLLFAFDNERVRELGEEPALMRCPLCSHLAHMQLRDEVEKLRTHRDLLLKAIDLKVLLENVAP